MTLTGQVFLLVVGIAAPGQARMVYDSARAKLWDVDVGGFPLNTDSEAVRMDLVENRRSSPSENATPRGSVIGLVT